MENKVKTIIEQLRSIEISKVYLKELREKKREYQERITELQELTDNALIEIEQFDNNSFRSVLDKFLKGQKPSLEVAKQYYLDIVLEYNELLKAVGEIDFEIEILKNKISSGDSAKNELKRLLKNERLESGISEVKELKQVNKRIDSLTGLIFEMTEAIDEGKTLNRKFNSAINFLKRLAESIYTEVQDVDEMQSFEVFKLDRYQDHIIKIQHGMMKFEIEVNDIYKILMRDKSMEYSIGGNFLKDCRLNLIADVQSNKQLNNSYRFLESYKSLIMNYARTLRSDIKKVKLELKVLEDKENRILRQLLN